MCKWQSPSPSKGLAHCAVYQHSAVSLECSCVAISEPLLICSWQALCQSLTLCHIIVSGIVLLNIYFTIFSWIFFYLDYQLYETFF